MINHIVLFKLQESQINEKENILFEVKSLLESLKDKIPEVKFLEVGMNYEVDAKSYDIVLLSHFNSIDDLDKYRVHPEHLKVVARIGEITVSRAAVDFQF